MHFQKKTGGTKNERIHITKNRKNGVKVLGTYKKQNDAMYDADWDIEPFKKNGKVINQTQERSGNTLTLGYEFEDGSTVAYQIVENEYNEDF